MTLRGRVLDTRGGPIAGARVGRREPVLTDADGRFVLDGLTGSLRFRIEADGKAPFDDWTRFLQQEIAAGSAERTYRLGDGAILRGRVVGPDGHAVAGAKIRIRDDRPPIEADESGRFEVAIESPGRPHRFAVHADGYAAVRLDPITVAAGEVRDDLVVRLTRGGGIEGRVVTESGAPIAGHPVSLRTWPWLSRGLATIYRRTTTAADGRFRFEALAAGSYDVSANGKYISDRVYAPKGHRRGIRVEEGKTVSGIVLVPAPRISLRGRALDDRGRPLAGVRVVSWSGPSRARSDQDGRFVLDGMPVGGPCQFRVSKDDYRLLRSKSSLPERVTADNPELVIRMAPIPPGIRGQVLRADTGAPVPSFWVRLHRGLEKTGPDGTPRFRSSMTLEHFQDAEGRFWLTRFRGPGAYALEAGTEDGLISESPVPARVVARVPPPVVELRLVAGAVVRGRVLAPDGTPIDRARVVACDPDDGRWLGEGWSFTQPDGIYVIKGIPPGEVELQAKHDDWYEMRTTVRAEAGRTVEQDLRLGQSGAVLEVEVLDVVGEPVAGARVRLFTPKGDEVYWDQHKYFALYAKRFAAQGRTSFDDRDIRHEIEQTSPTGRLERRFLPPGDYVVKVSKEGYRPARRTVSIRLEGKNAVAISLARAR
jgi:protocatechuate 3,4-dioxygenase beta subunit